MKTQIYECIDDYLIFFFILFSLIKFPWLQKLHSDTNEQKKV